LICEIVFPTPDQSVVAGFASDLLFGVEVLRSAWPFWATMARDASEPGFWQDQRKN